MAALPVGFGDVTIPFQHQLVPRQAAITFGIACAFDGANPNNIANAIQAAFMAVGAPGPRIDSNVTVGPTEVVANIAGQGVVNGVSATAAQGGRSSSFTVPQGSAVLVKKQTAGLGKRFRGRLFVPWTIDFAQMSEVGILVANERQLLENAWTQFHAALGVNETFMHLLHSDSVHSATPPPTLVTNLTVDPLISSQRRRLGR